MRRRLQRKRAAANEWLSRVRISSTYEPPNTACILIAQRDPHFGSFVGRREMFDALLADLKNGVLEGAWNARLADQLAQAAARSLNDSGLRRALLQALLQAVASADAKEYDLTPALRTAFGMACSNMGAEVAVTGQPAAERAVLVCGFAGACPRHHPSAACMPAQCPHWPLTRRTTHHPPRATHHPLPARRLAQHALADS